MKHRIPTLFFTTLICLFLLHRHSIKSHIFFFSFFFFCEWTISHIFTNPAIDVTFWWIINSFMSNLLNCPSILPLPLQISIIPLLLNTLHSCHFFLLLLFFKIKKYFWWKSNLVWFNCHGSFGCNETHLKYK